jgi:hypothetical protein
MSRIGAAKRVMVRSVDDRHVDIGAPPRLGRKQAGKTGADDRNAGPPPCQLACNRELPCRFSHETRWNHRRHIRSVDSRSARYNHRPTHNPIPPHHQDHANRGEVDTGCVR